MRPRRHKTLSQHNYDGGGSGDSYQSFLSSSPYCHCACILWTQDLILCVLIQLTFQVLMEYDRSLNVTGRSDQGKIHLECDILRVGDRRHLPC